MKKIIPIVILIGLLVGYNVFYHSKTEEAKFLSQELNDEHIFLYENILEDTRIQDGRRKAYKESYRTFMLYASEENMQNNPNLYLGIEEE